MAYIFWGKLIVYNCYYSAIHAQCKAINRFRLHCFVYPQSKQKMEHNIISWSHKCTRCVRKVSDLRLYLRVRALDWPLRGMSVTSSPSQTPWISVRRTWTRAHCVFLIQPTYGSGARKKPWAGRVHGGGRLRPRSANTALNAAVTGRMPWVARSDRSTNLHQVLHQSRQELYWDNWNDIEGLCGR